MVIVLLLFHGDPNDGGGSGGQCDLVGIAGDESLSPSNFSAAAFLAGCEVSHAIVSVVG